MRILRQFLVGTLALGAIGAGAATADAQIISRESAPRGWLGIGFEGARQGAGARPLVRITSVTPDSPAERAGLNTGDILMSVNGINASEELIQSLAFSLAPGETVNFRIRRGDAEHDVTVLVGERPAGVAGRGRDIITINTDSVRGLARVWLDSARYSLDNLRLPEILLELPRVRIGTDSLDINFPGASFIRVDTLNGGQVRILMRGDTLLRAEMDSVVRRLGTANFLARDSAFTIVRGMNRAPFEGMSFFSTHSIAGAELARLEPEMEGYFGTADGVLVLRVGEQTPAARAGMRPGDVIIGVNDEPVRSVEDVRRLVAATVPGGRPVRLELMRERRAIRVELPRD